MFPLSKSQMGRASGLAGRWPEVLFGLVPSSLLLLFSVYLLVFPLVLLLRGFGGDLSGMWVFVLIGVLGSLSCVSMFRVFNLNRRGRWPNALAPAPRRLLTAGLGVGLLLSVGSLLFLSWAGLNLAPLGWPVVLFVFVSPSVVAVRYLFLLRSPGDLS